MGGPVGEERVVVVGVALAGDVAVEAVVVLVGIVFRTWGVERRVLGRQRRIVLEVWLVGVGVGGVEQRVNSHAAAWAGRERHRE